MNRGLVFGKFMPLHKGHQALIHFALQHCDELLVVLCHTAQEPIGGGVRLQWLKNWTISYPSVNVIDFPYDDRILPNSSASDREVARLWSEAFQQQLPAFTHVFTSEPYGDYIAEYLRITHISYDTVRQVVPVSATQIRKNPLACWHYLADEAKPYFTVKVAIVGTESTGKSILTQRLAEYFHTAYVPEMAREIAEETLTVTPAHLQEIAQLHACTILERLPAANRILIADTDLITTQSYSQFLFGQDLDTAEWIGAANRFDLYLFLEPDCPFIQDGTRLDQDRRNRLSDHHRVYYEACGRPVVFINGDWEQRFRDSVNTIYQYFPALRD